MGSKAEFIVASVTDVPMPLRVSYPVLARLVGVLERRDDLGLGSLAYRAGIYLGAILAELRLCGYGLAPAVVDPLSFALTFSRLAGLPM